MALVCANDRCRLDVHHDGACDDGGGDVYDGANVYYAARDLVAHVERGPADDDNGAPFNKLVRAVYDAAAAVLGLDAAVDSA